MHTIPLSTDTPTGWAPDAARLAISATFRFPHPLHLRRFLLYLDTLARDNQVLPSTAVDESTHTVTSTLHATVTEYQNRRVLLFASLLASVRTEHNNPSLPEES